MTGRLRPYTDIDELQHKAIDALYNNDEQLALLETGFGKTLVALTAGEELRAAGVVKRPLVFAPLRVATNTWPNERFEWEHLQHVPMVEWGGPPEDWAPSLWKESRTLYGQRTMLEAKLPTLPDRVRKKLLTAAQKLDPKIELKDLNPNEVKDAILVASEEAQARIKDIKADERAINRQIKVTEPPEAWHVLSLENTEWFCDLYEPGESPFDLWVIDETGKLARNPKSPRYKALKKHMPKAKIRWGLNATPAPEGAEDLFGQVQVVCGKRLWGASFYAWRQKYFTPADYMGYSWRLQLGAFDLLMKDLNSVAFRAPATAYGKTYTPREITVELPPKARAAYDDMEKQMAIELETLKADSASEMIVAMSEAAASQKLRQICQGYLYSEDEKGRRVVHHLHDEKTNALAELLDSLGREPLLIGFQFDEDMENIRKVFKNIPTIGKTVSSAQANETIARWNKRELSALAAQTSSISHGLNLQYGGHHVCHYALPWGLDPYKQFNERVDRRGQTHLVYGHHIVAANSKDQDVSQGLMDKDADQNKLIAAIRKL
mgnify:CR=1 FL=1